MAFVKADISNATYKAMRDIHNYNSETQERIKEVTRDKTHEVLTVAIQLAPYRTGKFKATIREEIKTHSQGIYGRVFTNSPVAHLIEFGTKGHVVMPKKKKALVPGAAGWFMTNATIPAISAKPFMKPAMDKVRPTIEGAIKVAIKK